MTVMATKETTCHTCRVIQAVGGSGADVTIRHKAQGIEVAFCRNHVFYYLSRPETFEVVSIAPGLAICERCGRVIGRNARAAHHSYKGVWCTPPRDDGNTYAVGDTVDVLLADSCGVTTRVTIEQRRVRNVKPVGPVTTFLVRDRRGILLLVSPSQIVRSA